MFFHIDESGNTGNNLFDANQPRLSYGLLSSKTNVDALGVSLHEKIVKQLGLSSLHANELGVDRLSSVAPLLCELHRKMRFDFDYYYINKTDYAITKLFEAIFDQGLNDAVTWEAYWTPLRYLLLFKLASLVDEPLLRQAWKLCTVKRVERYTEEVVELLEELNRRVGESALDGRAKELMSDAFQFGIAKPTELDFGAPDPKFVSPNAVGFQFVVYAMARRLRQARRKKAHSIKVDQQAEFNRSQDEVHSYYKLISYSMARVNAHERAYLVSHPHNFGVEEDVVLHRGIPRAALSFTSATQSIGLQIVDIYLWMINRRMSGLELTPELDELTTLFLPRSVINGISLRGLEGRFLEFERSLPRLEDLSDEQLEMARVRKQAHREKVRQMGF